eukprot:CAMPEP_0176091646 /NCGR_PEP_ID=MMETSP0120_2-20121206/45906_1 /TAXON_ID=160619 /ORGANISM="Kryptoperidinium foliaceum, Strain CCMP 1326" /LENGTH=75 /DNA_ID=CAMNT_0017425545 /DNA_START=447 /DNA_END=671 /DNA_ORIENTATION=+
MSPIAPDLEQAPAHLNGHFRQRTVVLDFGGRTALADDLHLLHDGGQYLLARHRGLGVMFPLRFRRHRAGARQHDD